MSFCLFKTYYFINYGHCTTMLQTAVIFSKPGNLQLYEK